jgi:hypothetical protein
LVHEPPFDGGEVPVIVWRAVAGIQGDPASDVHNHQT